MSKRSILQIIFICVALANCTKQSNVVPAGDISALNVVNLLQHDSPIIIDFYGNDNKSNFFPTARPVPRGSFFEWSIPSGNVPLAAYLSSDSTNAIFSTQGKSNGLQLLPMTSYSLFFSGNVSTSNFLDTLFVIDKLPSFTEGDSSFGIRFVNLLPVAESVNIRVSGANSTDFVSNLSNHRCSGFMKLSAGAGNSSYQFDFVDSRNDSLLASYSISGVDNGSVNTLNNRFRNRNFTIVLYNAAQGADDPIVSGTLLVDNY